ncbi:hypothetical protein SpCBS45565_g06211 [Spizellomyces sp. 'palustris']|nr:hypothetical protein SpCBS45565_g06211 [Spizellomyces sp. 'palustris']
MLDAVTVLTKGGLVLWSKAYTDIRGPQNPIDSLIRDVLIEEKASSDGYVKDNWRVKWTFANELGLIFVIVYQKILQLAYIDELLEAFKRLFCKDYASKIATPDILRSYDDFEQKFDTLLAALETDELKAKRSKGPRKFEDTKGYQNTLAGSKNTDKDTSSIQLTPEDTDSESHSSKSVGDSLDEKLNALGLTGRRGAKGKRRGGKASGGSRNASQETSPIEGRKSIKASRTWVDGVAGSTPSGNLDYSDSKEPTAVVPSGDLVGTALGSRTADGLYDALEMDERLSDDESDETTESASTKPKGILSFFQNLTSAKVLKRDDLEPIMAKMREHMVNKNVAADVADHLSESVLQGLAGKKIGAFSSLTSAVKSQMESALRRILTPRTSTDVLRDIFSAQQSGRPYTITFVGVNGVGKSTNLSKVCFWLLQNNLKVLIAACDTFRSGAVEQLKVHERNLKIVRPGAIVELFDRGYGKDPAGIAKDAIAYAKNNHFDVVLIDTAGRMQDNEPLMRALAKLVAVNNPDKVIFVGEALVGNEAVDQLTKFNQALKDFSGLSNPRQIDGMILTKFDTIDDKVGAALSMTYITGQPILFVGTGQTYTDLRKMNVRSIVNSLLAK